MVSGTGSTGRRKVRAGLVLFMASAMSEGCLVAAPPDFRDPAPERPNISVGLVVPAPWQILTVERNGPTIYFTIPFQANNAGEKVIAQVWLNWGLEGEGEGALDQKFWEPQTDIEHQLSWSWVPKASVAQGCQQLTIIITHESNISDSSPIKPIDPELTAFITFWLNVDPDPLNPTTLVNCPGPSPE